MAVQLDAVVAVWQDIPDKAKGMLDQMLMTTRTGLDETRRALRALRAEPLEEMGLALAVRTLAEDFAAIDRQSERSRWLDHIRRGRPNRLFQLSRLRVLSR